MVEEGTAFNQATLDKSKWEEKGILRFEGRIQALEEEIALSKTDKVINNMFQGVCFIYFRISCQHTKRPILERFFSLGTNFTS